MPQFSFETWLLIAIVAVVSFLLGRLTAREGAEAGADRARQEEFGAVQAYSSLPPHLQSEIDKLAIENRQIEAIRLVREESDLGLREAKAVVDRRRKSLRGA